MYRFRETISRYHRGEYTRFRGLRKRPLTKEPGVFKLEFVRVDFLPHGYHPETMLEICSGDRDP